VSSCAPDHTCSTVPLNSIDYHACLEVQDKLLNQHSKATIDKYTELHNYRESEKKKKGSIT